MWWIIGFFIAHWYLSLFTQSFFNHRYAAHQQFKMSRFWERIFFVFSYIFQGSSYLSPNAYAMMHRMHHAYTDTEKDPHSPKFSKGLMDMMWKTKRIYHGIYRETVKVEERFKQSLPGWYKFDRFAESWPSRLLWVVAYVIFYAFFATQWWMYLILPIHFVMGPFHGAIINWYAHKIGYSPNKMSNTSTNLFFWDLLMLGEGLHNNHHKYPKSANFAKKWYEFDPLYPVIKLFHYLHIIRLPQTIKATA